MSDEPQEIRKLAAIMFTDMVGYSALTQKNESLAIQLLEEHRSLLRPLFPKYGGREIETVGDAFFVEFGSAVEAVRCAVEMQHTLHERNQTHGAEEQIRIRIGIHIGDVIQKGNHVLGDGVNIAARLEPLAPPEGICISEDVARQVQNKLDIPLYKIGQRNLKNIQFPMEIYSVQLPWGPQIAEEAALTPKQERIVVAGAHFWRRVLSQPLFAAAVGSLALLAAWYFLTLKKTVTELDVSPSDSSSAVLQDTTPAQVATVTTQSPPPVKSKETPLIVALPNQPQRTVEEQTKKQLAVVEKKPVAPPVATIYYNPDSVLAHGREQYRKGELSDARMTLGEALNQYRATGNKRGEADALLAISRVLKHQDELAEAETKAREAAALFKSLDNTAGIARSQVILADVLIEQGKAKEAESVAGLVVLALPASDEAFVARALLAKAHAALDNMEDALKQAQYLDENRQRTPDTEWNAFVVTTVVRIRAMANALDRTKRERQNFESEIQQSGNVPAQMEGRLAYGEVAMTLGTNPAMGRQRLTALSNDATAKGFLLIARKARERLRN
jgi:class 3 adenylate cyclase